MGFRLTLEDLPPLVQEAEGDPLRVRTEVSYSSVYPSRVLSGPYVIYGTVLP